MSLSSSSSPSSLLSSLSSPSSVSFPSPINVLKCKNQFQLVNIHNMLKIFLTFEMVYLQSPHVLAHFSCANPKWHFPSLSNFSHALGHSSEHLLEISKKMIYYILRHKLNWSWKKIYKNLIVIYII